MSTWIKNHELTLFFILAFAISWCFMIPPALSAQGLIAAEVPYGLYYLASFGPMLAALALSALVAGGAGVRRLLSGLLKWRVGWGYFAFSVLAPFAFFFRDTYTEMGVLGFPIFVISVVFASVLLAWLYNSTRGSLLMVVLFHALFNWLSVSEAGGPYVAILMGAAAVFWAVRVLRVYGPENHSPEKKVVV
jgi:hypothetical protein